MKRSLSKYEAIGILPCTNHSSLGLFRTVYKWGEDFVEVGLLVSEHSEVETRLYKLYSTGYGSYFNYKGRRYYLNEFCRC